MISTTIPESMKGVFLPGAKQVNIRSVPVPSPGYGQVLVQTRASALCGSDLRSIYRPEVHKTGAEGYLGVVAGHEPCGVIVKKGEGVPNVWKEWTRVVVYHIQGCGACHHCRQGFYISCEEPQRKAYGWQRDGGHAEYILVDMQSLVRLPESLTYLDGAIVACGFGTAYAACLRAQVSGRDRVLITGLGPVGLGAALLCQKMGATVLGLEYEAERVAFARKTGIEAVECSKSGAGDSEKDLKVIRVWTNGEGPNVVIDCSGSAIARLTGLKAAACWGRVVFVGEGGRVEFDVSEVVIHKNLTIYGSWVCSIGQMEELVDRLVTWNLHPEVTVTNTFAINEAETAYKMFDTGKTGKCAILYQGESQQFNA